MAAIIRKYVFGLALRTGLWLLILDSCAVVAFRRTNTCECYVQFEFFLPPLGFYDPDSGAEYYSRQEPTEVFSWLGTTGLVYKRFPASVLAFPKDPFFRRDVDWVVIAKPGRVGDFLGFGYHVDCVPEDPVLIYPHRLPQYPIEPVEPSECGQQGPGTVFLRVTDPETSCPGLEGFHLFVLKANGALGFPHAEGRRCEDLLLRLEVLQEPSALFLVVQERGGPAKAVPAKVFKSLSGDKCYLFRLTIGPRIFYRSFF